MPTTTTPGTIFKKISSEADDFVTVAQMTSATSGFALDTNVVHKTGVESIAGNKTFTGNIFVGNTAATSIEITSSNIQKIVAGISTTYNLPASGGTLALQGEWDYLTEITWSELKTLRDTEKLIPGMQYRITDYVTMVYDFTGYSFFDSAHHEFDLIVVADSTNKLNEQARAIQHAGDTYFANSKLNKWEIKYCLDNDDSTYAWADTTSGKGVIYWMRDEFGNECGYDFKNVLFKRYSMEGAVVPDGKTKPSFLNSSTPSLKYGFAPDVYSCFNVNSGADLQNWGYSSADPNLNYIYGPYLDYLGYGFYYAMNENTAKWCYTFYDSYYDKDSSLNSNGIYVYNNHITSYVINNVYQLTSNVFFDSCHSNTFGNNCYSNTFGNYCYSNTFGNYCFSNTFCDGCDYNAFGNYCYSNIFGGDGCDSNTFGNYCYYNTFGSSCCQYTFGNYCHSNTFGNDCYSNTFGNSCFSNTFGNSCDYNTFGNNCHSNTFGNSCDSNTFGNDCQYNTFGTGSSLKTYYYYIIFENGVIYVDLNCTASGLSYNSPYKNVKVTQGVRGTYSSRKIITDSNKNQNYQTVYAPANSQTISV